MTKCQKCSVSTKCKRCILRSKLKNQITKLNNLQNTKMTIKNQRTKHVEIHSACMVENSAEVSYDGVGRAPGEPTPHPDSQRCYH